MERHLLSTSWVLVILLVFGVFPLKATNWQVGAGRAYTVPSQVADLVRDGDTVSIDAGDYTGDVALWRANGLVIQGIGGMAHLRAAGKHYGGKAIWVIAGHHTTIKHIGFYDCVVPDKNGAGIRQEGRYLTVLQCLFRNNENGILANAVSGSKIVIQRCEFDGNGFGDGYSHNLYINQVDTLVFEFNYSHHANIGHELKSRAKVNFIRYNRLTNEATGTASRNLDLSNGGIAFIIGNVIEEGIASVNHNMIGYALEGASNVMPNYLYLINNTLINRYNGGSFLHLGQGTDFLKAYNNIVAGAGSWLLQSFTGMLDTLANVFVPDIAALALEDEQAYLFQPTSLSILINGKAKDPGVGFGRSLLPTYHYVHPADGILLCQLPMQDIGALPYCTSTHASGLKTRMPTVYPNPVSDLLYINHCEGCPISVWDMSGKLCLETKNATELPLQHWPVGVYFLAIKTEDAVVFHKLIKQ